MILRSLGKLLGGPKTKVFLGVVLTLTLIGSFLYYRLDSVKQALTLANEEIEKIAQDLRTSESTVDNLERDIQLTLDLLREKEQASQANRELAEELQQRLQEVVQNDEKLQECLAIDLSGYVDGLQPSTRETGN